ncbi:MAG: YraN family protein [Denitrovibrio sp.]|nr:MAG: YraN family protein [Denitrovibrio sp.]
MSLLFGNKGEKKATDFLKKKGYKLLDKNYRCKYGEIDIIMEIGDILVFIEVKARSSEKYGLGYESVTTSKQEKLLKTAQTYMSENGERAARFDVVSIDGDKITHIENAF